MTPRKRASAWTLGFLLLLVGGCADIKPLPAKKPPPLATNTTRAFQFRAVATPAPPLLENELRLVGFYLASGTAPVMPLPPTILGTAPGRPVNE